MHVIVMVVIIIPPSVKYQHGHAILQNILKNSSKVQINEL